MTLREWIDPLIFAYILAMFIRTFVVELFKIPTGSMTPTLVGDVVAEFDYADPELGFEEDGLEDLIVASGIDSAGRPQGKVSIFKMGVDGYEMDKPAGTTTGMTMPVSEIRKFQENYTVRYDRICVNKFAYWFTPASRGDIVVFKVPRNIFDPQKPVYVKRAVGLPGEHISIQNETGDYRDNRLWINGAPVTEPEFFPNHYYSRDKGPALPREGRILGPAEYMMFGDNTDNSSDSRVWGTVPADNFRGKAFLRYMPFKHFRLL